MQDEGSDAQQVKVNGWRQGSILDDALVRELTDAGKLPSYSGEGRWIVISHDCDVTNGSFANEPNVELLYAKVLSDDEVDGNRNWAKNTRLLQFTTITPSGPVIYGCDANQRMVVHREPFARHIPAVQTMEATVIGLIANWIAKRYRRAAFADNFNIRTTRAASKIRDKAKKKGKWISGIYLLVGDDELPTDEVYDVILIATMRASDYSNEQARESATELLGVIESAFASCSGVNLVACELRSESDLSIDDLLRLKRWDYDDLTMRHEGPDAFQGDDR